MDGCFPELMSVVNIGLVWDGIRYLAGQLTYIFDYRLKQYERQFLEKIFSMDMEEDEEDVLNLPENESEIDSV